MPRRPTQFDLLILDCDGVVVDSEPITMRVLAEMLNELGASTNAAAIAQKLIGTTFDRTLEVITETLGKPLPADFVPHYRDRTFAAMEAGLKPVAGIEAALDRITIPCCIASNGPHLKIRKTLGITRLLPRFEGRIFSSADVPRGKPHPDLFLFAARHFAAHPSACLVIEDSVSGIKAARAAGMEVFGFAGSAPEEVLLAAGAHRVFRQMSDLPGLVDGAG